MRRRCAGLLAALLVAAAGAVVAAPRSVAGGAMVKVAATAGSAVAAGNPAADAAFIEAVYAAWYVPRSADFAGQAERLVESLGPLCEAGSAAADQSAARAQWLSTVASWERLSAVRAGALLARRSPREIDFLPTRPEAIARAVAAAPGDAAALDRIGSPAKGLPAIEWLLWSRPLASDGAACGYTRLAAEAVAAEAEALQAAYRRTAAQGRDAAEVEYAVYELLNLWDAGLQKLWWEDLQRPLEKAQDGRAPPWNRAASGHTVDGWRQQWQGLRALAVGAAAAEVAGAAVQGAAIDGASLRRRLLADGHAAEAAQLMAAVAAVDHAMAALPATPASADAGPAIAAAVAALKALQQFAENDMATALNFIVSFFDEDGD